MTEKLLTNSKSSFHSKNEEDTKEIKCPTIWEVIAILAACATSILIVSTILYVIASFWHNFPIFQDNSQDSQASSLIEEANLPPPLPENSTLSPSDIKRVLSLHSNPQCMQEILEEIIVFESALITREHLTKAKEKCQRHASANSTKSLDSVRMNKQLEALRSPLN